MAITFPKNTLVYFKKVFKQDVEPKEYMAPFINPKDCNYDNRFLDLEIILTTSNLALITNISLPCLKQLPTPHIFG